ncbi:DoxX family protein [Parapedobacter lycopersici]|uniref:DoxX family protein n=1 Tax=Parapedobacter lycopersici TaxID=1864939 RepID=UPI00333E9B7C
MTVYSNTPESWSVAERFLFRVAGCFFLTMCIPLSWNYYRHLFSLDWSDLNYRDITNLGRFSPNLLHIQTESGQWGFASYSDWGIILLGSLIVAALWSLVDGRQSHHKLYYWLRVIVRYRIAIGMIEFGFVKVFLIQMPFPPIATLHTNFGDFTAQKLYWLSVGIVPGYQVFLGLVEVTAGFLLFFRKTAFLGAFLTLCASANIVYINHAYDGGVHVYSAYFVLLALFLLWRDIPRIGKLLVYEQDTTPLNYYPNYSGIIQKTARILTKSMFILVFVVLLAILHWRNYNSVDRNMKLPVEPGLAEAAGYYEVTAFNWKGSFIPSSPFDSIRWQDAIFETYSTLSFKINQPIPINLSNGVPRNNGLLSDWEFSGRGGGRRFYYYEVDTIEKVLQLQDKQQPGSPIPIYLAYERPNDSTIVLRNKSANSDLRYIRLTKIFKRYPLIEKDDY